MYLLARDDPLSKHMFKLVGGVNEELEGWMRLHAEPPLPVSSTFQLILFANRHAQQAGQLNRLAGGHDRAL